MKKYILIAVMGLMMVACTNTSFLIDDTLEELPITKGEPLIAEEITLTVAGSLSEKLGERLTTIQKLKLAGPIDADDVNTFRNEMPALVALDIKGVEFVESEKKYKSPWGEHSVKKTGIATYMFARMNISQIAIPENMEFIEEYAFSEAPIESILLSDKITKIGQSAFQHCTKLSAIVIPKNIKFLPNYLFNSCTSLESVVFPEELTSIGNLVFDSCPLIVVDLPKTVTEIGSFAFSNTKIKSINIPGGVKVIETGCFQGCRFLEEVQLPSGITSILGSAFNDCTSLKTINIPNTVTELMHNAFGNCSSLISMKLPNGIKVLNGGAFSRCLALKEINLPENLEIIGGECFNGCRDLLFIDIPKTVKDIEYGVFFNCRSLCAIYLNGKITVGNILNTSSNCLVYLSDPEAQLDASIKNIIINGVASSITLTDQTAFFCPREFKAQKITFTKSFNNSGQNTILGKAAGWSGFCLPFNATTITHADGRVLAPFNAEVAGAKPFWLRKLTANGFENVTSIEAGVPYILAMPNNRQYAADYNITGKVTFSAQDVDNGITIPVSTYQEAKGPLFNFTSNYGYKEKSSTIYLLNTNDYVENYNYGGVFARSLRECSPFESYVTNKSIATKAPNFFSINTTPSTRSIRIVGNKPAIDDM